MVKEGGRGGLRFDVDRLSDIPFEFEGEVASTSAMTEAGYVECGSTAARHGLEFLKLMTRGRSVKEELSVLPKGFLMDVVVPQAD